MLRTNKGNNSNNHKNNADEFHSVDASQLYGYYIGTWAIADEHG